VYRHALVDSAPAPFARPGIGGPLGRKDETPRTELCSMKFVMWIMSLVWLTVACGAGMAQTPSVKGTVTDTNNQAVAGVEVTARNFKTREKMTTTTGGNGGYEISGLPEGTYKLSFRRDGFMRGEQPSVMVRAERIPVKVDWRLEIAPPSTGSLSGVVRDPEGGVVPGALVAATDALTAKEYTAVADEDGSYQLQVPRGNYRLVMYAMGFKSYVVPSVSVSPSQETGVDVAMEAGAISETVTVTAGISVIDEYTSVNLTMVDGHKVAELPLSLSGSVNNLALLSPGIVSNRSGEGLGVSVNGNRARSNNFMIDGVDNNDQSIGAYVADSQVQELPFGTIQEATIASPIEAEMGRGPGGIVNIMTRSGGNDLHGSGFYFHRNSRLDARDFFETRKSPSRAHRFGFTVGGPVVRNRTFFFGSYEGNREFEARPHLLSVPSPPRLAAARSVLAAHGLTENPLSVRLLQFFPPPERARDFHNLAVNSPAVRDSDSFNVRLDHNFNDSNYTLVRYYASRSEQMFPLTPSFFQGFRADFSGRAQMLYASLRSVIKSTNANEALFSYARDREHFSPEDRFFDPASIGLNTGVNDPERFGLPFIKITGFDALGAPFNLPGRETATTWQLKDVFTKIIHDTDLKVGADFRRVLSNSLNEAGTRGRIFFDGSVLGDPLADFLAGLPAGDTGILRGDPRRGLALNYFSWFAQAVIKINSRLTLNAGLRYEFDGVPREEQNRMSNFVPELGRLLPVGSAELPKLYRNDLNNFAPRLSFVWDVTGSGLTVMRAGWGLSYDAPHPRLFVSLCPCANSVGQGVTTNPAGASPVFAINPSGAIPFGPSRPVFGGAPGPDSPLDIHAVERNLKTPSVQEFSFGLQKEFPRQYVLELAYQGAVGTHLYRTLDVNQPMPGDPQTRDARRPFSVRFPQFRSINLLSSSARSSYHSLRLSVRRRMSHGLWFDAGYNFSKAIDDASGDNELPQDSRDLRAERSRSSFDRRHRFVLSFIYELPRLGPAVLHGWQVAGNFRAESGRPFTPIISFDNSGTGMFVDRPNLIGDPRVSQDSTQLYSLLAFRVPQRGTLGNLGRNSLEGPGSNSLDFTLMKKTGLWPDKSLELRLDFFNLLNHPNFRMPNSYVDDPAFGRVNATEVYGGRRRIQIGVRLLF
jgi:hypothetical protein